MLRRRLKMKTILSSRRRHYLARIGTFLIAVALIAGMVGCGQPAPSYTLTISSTTGGKVTTPGEGTFTYYAKGVIVLVVALVAEADEGYYFVNWTGDVGTIGNVSAASTNITVQGDYSITANFVNLYNLTISSTAGGNVTEPGEGTHAYEHGMVVDLVAVADDGYSFVEWTGDVGTVGNVSAANTTITMNGDYTITANFFHGHLIRDWYDLDAVRDDSTNNYLLMNDLDSDTAGYTELASETANSGSGWNPIGSFTGTFDGQGYEINDLFINRPSKNYVGLFGLVGSGVIENVGVNGNVTGHDYVGGLVGMSYCAVSDSYSTCNVTGHYYIGGLVGRNRPAGNVINCYATGMVTGISYSAYAGGLVGQIDSGGQVIDSYSTGCATSGNVAGGLIGYNFGTVNNCYSSGNVTGYMNNGGLMGVNSGAVNNCYSSGNVTGTLSQYVGGLVGQDLGTMSNCFWDTDTSGQLNSAGGIGKTTLEMQDIDTFTAWWDIIAVGDIGERDLGHTWNIVDDVTYPFLSWQPV